MRSLLDTLYNFHWIREGVAARSSQAHFGGLTRLMRRHGLKSIVNLRGENSDLSWWRYEKRVCAALGARHFDTMLDSRKLPTRAMLVRLMVAFEEAPRPLLLKCSGGNDRTALAAALLLIHQDGWSGRLAAEKQFTARPKPHQRWLKLFPAFAEEAAAGMPLAEWVRTAYDPEALAEWLREHGHADSFERIFTAPTRSPWQL
jgi:protein tyrosine/serine phosphatase